MALEHVSAAVLALPSTLDIASSHTSAAALVAGGVLMFIGVLHSVLGELGILRPLFAATWQTEGIPRAAIERILRFAWHLTTLAWVALGLTAIGWPPLLALALCGFGSALAIFVMLRGHLAWPLFLVVGGAALAAHGALPAAGLAVVAAAAGLVALGASALHVYWAFGGTAGIHAAVPSHPDGRPVIMPGMLATLAVAAALLVYAGLLAVPWFAPDSMHTVSRWLLWLGVALLSLRAVGDGKRVGFSKRSHETLFERMDDALYTPLVVLLTFGAASAAIALG